MNKDKLIFKICLASVMASLAFALSFLKIDIGFNRITIYGLPLMITSIFFGPFVGILSGIVCGFLMQLTSQYGLTITAPLWMLAPILWSTIGGLYIKIFKIKKPFSLINVIIIVVSTSLLVSLTNTIVYYLDALILKYTLEQTILTITYRFLASLLMCVPYTFIIYNLRRLKEYSFLKD